MELIVRKTTIAELCLFILLIQRGFVWASASNVQMDIARKLLQNYDGDFHPPGANGTGPTIVSVNFYIRSIEDVNPEEMIWTTQLTFRMHWLDERLAFRSQSGIANIRYLTWPSSLRSKLWKPDIFFSNERKMHFHNALLPNEYYRVFPNGEVLHSIRLTVTLSCPMIFLLFPLDRQTCSLRMASYGFTTEDIIFKWKAADPVLVTSDLHLPKVALDSYTTDYCDSMTNTGTYSCLRVDLLFKREFATYFNRIYLPLVASVILAWLSFWLNPIKSSIPRVVLLLLAFLYAKTIPFELLKSTNKVSYTTLADKWITTCSTFLYLAIVEFVVITFLATRNVQHVKGKDSLLNDGQGIELREINLSSENQNEDGNATGRSEKRFNLQNIYAHLKRTGWSTRIDYFFRLVYPIAYVLYIVIYVANYMASQNKEHLGYVNFYRFSR